MKITTFEIKDHVRSPLKACKLFPLFLDCIWNLILFQEQILLLTEINSIELSWCYIYSFIRGASNVNLGQCSNLLISFAVISNGSITIGEGYIHADLHGISDDTFPVTDANICRCTYALEDGIIITTICFI